MTAPHPDQQLPPATLPNVQSLPPPFWKDRLHSPASFQNFLCWSIYYATDAELADCELLYVTRVQKNKVHTLADLITSQGQPYELRLDTARWTSADSTSGNTPRPRRASCIRPTSPVEHIAQPISLLAGLHMLSHRPLGIMKHSLTPCFRAPAQSRCAPPLRTRGITHGRNQVANQGDLTHVKLH